MWNKSETCDSMPAWPAKKRAKSQHHLSNCSQRNIALHRAPIENTYEEQEDGYEQEEEEEEERYNDKTMMSFNVDNVFFRQKSARVSKKSKKKNERCFIESSWIKFYYLSIERITKCVIQTK